MHPAQRARDVLQRGQMAEQVELLEHHADADAGALLGDGARRQRLAVVAKPDAAAADLDVPASQPSRWLMQRSSVLLPEPLGPSSATTSPTRTVRSTPASTGWLV